MFEQSLQTSKLHEYSGLLSFYGAVTECLHFVHILIIMTIGLKENRNKMLLISK